MLQELHRVLSAETQTYRQRVQDRESEGSENKEQQTERLQGLYRELVCSYFRVIKSLSH